MMEDGLEGSSCNMRLTGRIDRRIEAGGSERKNVEGEWWVGVVGEDCSGWGDGVAAAVGTTSLVRMRRLALGSEAAAGMQ